jgi:flagellar motor switch/type III secretory pathway protein FliN
MAAAALATTEKEKKTDPAPEGEDPRWQPVLGLPCQLTVDLSVPGFTVSDFLRLRVGSVLGTGWAVTRDLPLRINGTVAGWGELEAAGKRLALRLTDLA